jgi:two-component system nitrate/nitrite response regulator NarL
MLRRQLIATVVIGRNVLIREGIAGILRSANFCNVTSVSCVDDLPPGDQDQEQLALIVHTDNVFDSTIEQLEFLRDRDPRSRIAVVTNHYRQDEMIAAARAGTNGYFADVVNCEVFIKSIELMMIGETVFSQGSLVSVEIEAGSIFSKTMEQPRHDDSKLAVPENDQLVQQLSPRERTVLERLIEGDSNKCIARKIDVAEATVKVHVKAILRKIRVQNRTQAAIWGMNYWPPERSKKENEVTSTPPFTVKTDKRPFAPIGVSAPPADHIKPRRLSRPF